MRHVSGEPFFDFCRHRGGALVVRRFARLDCSAADGDDIAHRRVWNRVGSYLQRPSRAFPSLRLLGRCHSLDELLRCSRRQTRIVGLALDTAEFTIGGIDPVAFYEHNPDRVTHVHLKDTRYADTGEEYRMPGAESSMLRGGGGRHIERWFYELGTDGGLVDVPGFVAALRKHDFPGWVVVESDHGGNPAELAMLNSWYLQHELAVAKS